MSLSSVSSVVSVSSTIEAINSGDVKSITLAQGGFHFVNHTTGQEEHHCQGGMECKYSFKLKRAFFVRDGEAWVACNSYVNSALFKSKYSALETLAEDAHKAFDLPRKQFIKMLDKAYDKALSFAVRVEA